MSAPPRALSPADRRLAALTATFAPDAAARVLGRLTGRDGAAAWGKALAGLSREERLEALADAVASFTQPVGIGEARAVLGAERPPVARALRGLLLGREPWPGGAHPLLARAARELLPDAVRPPDPGA